MHGDDDTLWPVRPAALEALAARLEAATEDGRELDGMLVALLCGRQVRPGEAYVDGRWVDLPYPTDSLDQAVWLCEGTLPGWIWDVTSSGTAWVMSDKDSRQHFTGRAPTPALALCRAIVEAKLAEAGLR